MKNDPIHLSVLLSLLTHVKNVGESSNNLVQKRWWNGFTPNTVSRIDARLCSNSEIAGNPLSLKGS